jgi:secreted PhoX family phosphatase
MEINRRHFSVLASAFAFTGLAACHNSATSKPSRTVEGYGKLISDPNGLLDLPEGFSYEIISEYGQPMSDGFRVPDRADGMGCIPISDTKVALVRNHELAARHVKKGPAIDMNTPIQGAYDYVDTGAALPGGTSTLIYDLEKRALEKQYLSLAGTIRNCAGGVTPWGSWLTCEEDVTRAGDGVSHDHGWVFEVPALADGLVAPVPLKGLGRFNHEAAAIDPRTSTVYLTEDRNDSLFYRFLPKTPGRLNEGGTLQALAFADASKGADSRNWGDVSWIVGDWHAATWIDLVDTDSPKDDLRLRGHAEGAVLFARGEGIHWGDNELYFCCTSGGAAKLGQIMRYKPELDNETETSNGKLQLFLESSDPSLFNFGDNLTVAPNGHLYVCEDQYTDTTENHIRGVTTDGSLYDFARIRVQTEPAGACFTPDGSVLFVNLYSPAKTLAIRGPWDNVSEQTT